MPDALLRARDPEKHVLFSPRLVPETKNLRIYPNEHDHSRYYDVSVGDDSGNLIIVCSHRDIKVEVHQR